METKIEQAEIKLNEAHKLLSLLAHVPMDKYNPISQLLIESKDIIRLSHPVIDVEELRTQFDVWARSQNRNTLTIEETFNWFLPYLQPKEAKSEAVEFCNWVIQRNHASHSIEPSGEYYWHKGNVDACKSTSELYKEFKTKK